MNHSRIHQVAASCGLLLLFAVSITSCTCSGQPTTLTRYEYPNIYCTGEPDQVINYTLSEAGVCDWQGPEVPYVDPNGEGIFWYEPENGCPTTGPPTFPYSDISYEPLGNYVFHGHGSCMKYVITNPENAVALPIEPGKFPPNGWWVTYQFLNVTTGIYTQNCKEDERVVISADAMLCEPGDPGEQSVQPYCQDNHDTTATQAYYWYDGPACDGILNHVILTTLNTVCEDGVYYNCGPDTPIPFPDFNIAYTEYDYSNACVPDKSTQTILLNPDACVLSNDEESWSSTYSCNPNGTMSVIQYQNGTSCTGPVAHFLNYPVDTCLITSGNPNTSFEYTCSWKPNQSNIKRAAVDTSITTSTIFQKPPTPKKKKKILRESIF